MATNGLPDWAQWMQVVAFPATGLVISAVGIRVALLQKRLADVRIQHDLYDRRFRVYSAAKGLLVSVLADGCVYRPAFQAFIDGTADSDFLFDVGVVEYLNTVREKALRSINVQTRLSGDTVTEEARGKLVDEESELSEWFVSQFDTLRDKCRPFMRLDYKMRS